MKTECQSCGHVSQPARHCEECGGADTMRTYCGRCDDLARELDALRAQVRSMRPQAEPDCECYGYHDPDYCPRRRQARPMVIESEAKGREE